MATVIEARVDELIRQLDAAEEHRSQSLQRVRKFIALQSDPFARERGPEHATASAIVLSTKGVLLHRHKLSGLWLGPGGHIDAGESAAFAVTREVLEETGIAAEHPPSGPTIVGADTHLTSNHHTHHDATYVLLAAPAEPTPPSSESQDVRWFPVVEALATTDGSHAAALRAALALDLRLP